MNSQQKFPTPGPAGSTASERPGEPANLDVLRIDRDGADRPARGRRRRRGWVKWVVILLLLAAAAVVFREPLRQMGLPAVRVEKVAERSAAAVAAATGTSANGYVVARTRAALSADTPGRIVEMNVVEGAVVRAGDVVARLFADEYAAALRRAEAEVGLAERGAERARAEVVAAERELETLAANVQAVLADVEQARATLTWSTTSFERARTLLEQRVDTQDRVDFAQRELHVAQAALQASEARREAARKAVAQGEARVLVARAGVQQAQAQVAAATAARDLAQATLDKTAVRAPFDGVVVLKDAEVGEVVSPNSQGGSSARGSVVTMVDFATLEVQAEVPETTLSSVSIGASANIYLDAWPEKPYPGRVDRIWPTANRTKATVEVRVVFLERDERLRPEMGVRVVFGPAGDLARAPDEARILIPAGALAARDGAPGVFVLDAGRVRWRAVKKGDERAGKVAILEGLSPGEEFAVQPGEDLADGAEVRVLRADA